MKEISSMLLRGTLQPYGIKRSCSGMLSKESWIHFSNYYILSSFSLLFLLNFKQGAARSHSNSYLEIDIFVFATLVYWHLAIMELFLRKAIWRSIKIHLGLSVKHLQLLGKAECFRFSKCKYNRFEIFYFKSIGFFIRTLLPLLRNPSWQDCKMLPVSMTGCKKNKYSISYQVDKDSCALNAKAFWAEHFNIQLQLLQMWQNQ